MKAGVRETGRVKIRNVIVTPDAIREIVQIVDEARKALEVEHRHISCTFNITASDQSRYESTSTDIFSAGGLLETKQIQGIEISLYVHLEHEHVGDARILITNGDWSEPHNAMWNRIEVSGQDSTWVNGMLRQFENTISGWEKQASWPKRSRWLMYIVLTAGIMSFLYMVFQRLLHIQSSLWGWGWGFALISAVSLVDWFVGLWPGVEIRTGREFAQVSRRRRIRLSLIVSIGVLPLLLSIIYDKVKALL